MSYGNDHNFIGTTKVNDRIGKSMQHLPPNLVRTGVVFKLRGASRILTNRVKCRPHFNEKVVSKPRSPVFIPERGGDRLAIRRWQHSKIHGEP